MPRPIYPKSLLRGGSVRFDTGRNNYTGRDIQQCILRPPRYSHTMEHERRRAPRYPLIASVEVIEPQTNTHLRARTSDLSLVGCYLDMTYTPLQRARKSDCISSMKMQISPHSVSSFIANRTWAWASDSQTSSWTSTRCGRSGLQRLCGLTLRSRKNE